MTIPTHDELRALYAAALEANGGAIGSAAGLRAAVAVLLPEEADLPADAPIAGHYRQSERNRIRERFLIMADALAPLADLRQAFCDALAAQEQADG
jgi:hypothetical protein